MENAIANEEAVGESKGAHQTPKRDNDLTAGEHELPRGWLVRIVLRSAVLQRRGLRFRLLSPEARNAVTPATSREHSPRIPPRRPKTGKIIPPRRENPDLFPQVRALKFWSRGPDSNRRPSGYEPDSYLCFCLSTFAILR